MTTTLEHPDNPSSNQDKETLKQDNPASKEPSFAKPEPSAVMLKDQVQKLPKRKLRRL